jgi:hypothetical protein
MGCYGLVSIGGRRVHGRRQRLSSSELQALVCRRNPGSGSTAASPRSPVRSSVETRPCRDRKCPAIPAPLVPAAEWREMRSRTRPHRHDAAEFQRYLGAPWQSSRSEVHAHPHMLRHASRWTVSVSIRVRPGQGRRRKRRPSGAGRNKISVRRRLGLLPFVGSLCRFNILATATFNTANHLSGPGCEFNTTDFAVAQRKSA